MTLLMIAVLIFSQADAQTWYKDFDGDGMGNPSISQFSASQPSGFVLNNLDCNDNNVGSMNWASVGNPGFSAGAASYIRIATFGSSAYVVYRDGANSDKATVMKYNGTGWAVVGTAGFSAGSVSYTDIAIDGSGTPYVVYVDGGNSNKATVMKYNGTSWVAVGNVGFSAGSTSFTRIAIDTVGTPYVVYQDNANGDGVTVMKYANSNWSVVGSANIRGASTDNSNIVISGGVPYIAFNEYSGSQGIYVMKFNGSSWTIVGGQRAVYFTPTGVDLSVDRNGNPYVKYNSWDVYVVKYNGSSWVQIPNSIPYDNMPLTESSMAVSAAGTVYVFTHYEYYYSVRGLVFQPSGNYWNIVGSDNITTGDISYPHILFDSQDIPWMVFSDIANSNRATVVRMDRVVSQPGLPTMSASPNAACSGTNVTLSATGALNDAENWKWYAGSCGGTVVGTGTSISVSPTSTTVYYARGEGSCITSPGNCGTYTLLADTLHTWYKDADGDGWGDANNDSAICGRGGVPGYVPNNLDCKDNQVHATAWVNEGAAGFSAGAAGYTDIATSLRGTTFVAYRDAANGNKVTVMKKNGNSWVVVGSAGFTSTAPIELHLAVDKNDTVYMAYKDELSQNISVMKYNGSTWVTLGASLGASFDPIMLAVDPGNIPHVVSVQSGKPILHKYNGSNWTPVGNFTNGGYRASVAFDAYGIPYILYDNSSELRVYQYKANAWVAVGGGIGSLGSNPTRYSSIAIDDNGTPYVLWSLDPLASNYWPGNMLKFNGSSWVNLGSTPESATNSGKIAIDPSGNPYITYLSYNNNPGIIARKYNGSGWVAIGSSPVVGNGGSPSIAIDNKGLPQIVFGDGSNAGKATVKTIRPTTTNPTKPALATSSTLLCGGASATLTIQSGSLNDASQWHWYSSGCGGTPVGTGSSIQVTPSTTTTYYARGEASCLSAPGICDSIVIISNLDPVVTMHPGDSAICNNGSATFKANATGGGNIAYQWQVNTGAGYANISNGGIYSGATASTGILQLTGATTAANGNKYRCIVTNNCSKKDTSNEATLTVYPIPTVNAVSDRVICNGAVSAAINFSGAVTGTTYNWTNNNATGGLATSGSGNIASFTAANATNSPITATIIVTPTANGCTGTKDTFDITVNPTPTVAAVLSYQQCEGAMMAVPNFSGAVTGTAFNWTNSNTAIGLPASGTGNINAFTTTNGTIVSQTGTIIVTPVANGCTGTKDTFDIIVDPVPNISATADQVLCNGATGSITFSSNVPNTAHIWSNNTPSIGLAALGGGSISFTATNSTAAPVVATVIVTPAANGCPGTNDTFTITVNPTPNVVATPDYVLCNGVATTAVNFNGSVAGTNYGWVNNTTSIGLAANGSGNVAPFTATNIAFAPVTSTIVVTPTANGCTGAKDTFTIKVNPTPNVVATTDKTLCNNSVLSPVNFSSDVAGTTFSWTNNTTSIGLAANGTGNIASFTATNTGVAPVSSTVILTPTANGCTGVKDTFIINVNPTPTVNVTTDIVLCHGATTSATFTGAISTTTYSWTNNTPAIGYGPSGTGSISTFTASNYTSAPLIATFIVTPSANNCNGVSDTFNITVNPTPDVANVSNQAVCNGAATAAVNFSGFVTGTVYAWTNSTTSIGLAASGAGNIALFNAVNSSNTPVTTTVTVIPSANGCTGSQGVFDITVNPTPTVDAMSSQSLCHGAMVNSVTYTGAVNGTVYNWTNNNASIGLASIGAGNISSFAGKNTGAATVTATITVTPVANSCAGTAGTFDITVNPIPDVAVVNDQTLCNDAATIGVNFNGNVTGTLYSWVNTNTAIGLPATGTGNIASFKATNASANPITGTIMVTPSANNCTGLSESFDIAVNPTPKLSSTLTPQAICANTEFNYTPNSATFNTIFPWSRMPVAGITPATSNGGNSIAETLGNTTLTEIDVKYVYTLEANGCVNKDTVTVAVQPVPVIPTIETKSLGSVCRNTLFQNFSAEHPQPTGVEYRWTANNAVIWSSGSDNRNSLINFINAGPVLVKLTANVTGFTCTASDSFEVMVSSNSTSRIPTVAYYNKRFICLDNALDGYQWGYDDAATLDSVVLHGEVNQDYVNNNPDFINRYYWVITKEGDCSQKTYYNMPTGVQDNFTKSEFYMELYPNPATDYVNVEVKGLQSGLLNVVLMDITGKTIKTAQLVNTKAQVYIGDTAPGIYTVVYYHNGSRIGVAKLVKN